jgi:hypothetical protein
MRTKLLLVGMLALPVGCQEPGRLQAPAEPIPNQDGAEAYLVVWPPRPAVGDTVAVFVKARTGGAVGPIGSFTLELGYDAARLRFADAPPLEQGLRVHNPALAGTVRVAGAASEGFQGDLLFGARFVATASDAAAGLRLVVEELSASSSVQDLVPGLRVSPSPVFLRSSIPGEPAQPRGSP